MGSYHLSRTLKEQSKGAVGLPLLEVLRIEESLITSQGGWGIPSLRQLTQPFFHFPERVLPYTYLG